MKVYVLYERNDNDVTILVGVTTSVEVACEWERINFGEYYDFELDGALQNVDEVWPRSRDDKRSIQRVRDMLMELR